MVMRRYDCHGVTGFTLIAAVAAVSALLPARPAAQAQPALPAPPQVFLNTTYAPPTGQIIAVPAGGDVQAALNKANPGDIITLAAGATFTGPFVLPNKPGPGWIYVRSSAPDSALPPPGDRIAPSYAPQMPKLVVGPDAVYHHGVIVTVPGAHHFRFIGIEFAPTPGALVNNVIELGWGETTVDAVPHDIIFDRCYIHGDPSVGGARGIFMNTASTAVIDSYLSGFRLTDRDTEAIMSANGPGPFKIVNNYLEAAGINVMFGGQDPTIPNLVPADIEIRGNYFFKPLSWRIGDPTYAGTPWSVKNLFELKNARRALIDGNVFENNWMQADQDGLAILFTPRNQNGTAPWSTVQDVTFTNNIVRHSTGGINLMGWDDLSTASGQLQRVLIQNNLFTDIGAFAGNGGYAGLLFLLQDGTANVVIDHNTALQTEWPLYAQVHNVGRGPHTGFVLTNTITPNNHYGVSGDGTMANPMGTLTTYFPGAVVAGNVLPGGAAASYPPNNFFPATPADVGFANLAGGDYHLAAGSPYKHAGTDGKDIGANIDALGTATAFAVSGINPAAQSAPPTVSITPAGTDFGTVTVGGSADRAFTVTNLGGRTASGTISSGASPPFSVVSGGAFSLPPGASQTVVVRFAPPAAAAYGTAVVFAWGTGSAARVLTGTGAQEPPQNR